MGLIYSRIADLNIKFDCCHKDYFKKRLAEYIVDNEENIDLNLSFEIKDKIDIGNLELLEKNNGILLYKVDENTRKVVIYNTGVPIKAYSYSKDHTYAHIEFIPYEKQLFPILEREYLYSLDAFNAKILYSGGLCFHSSAISFNGSGIAFSAISGTGKSTHASLWRKYFPDETVHVNDDKPALVFHEDYAMLHGTPWSGKTDINTNISVPLKALVFIRQAAENKAYKLDVKNSYFHVLNNAFKSYSDLSLDDKYIIAVEKVLKLVPCYMLECNISREAVDTIKSRLEDDNVI